jgi:AcrR family transcriptional regulator
MPTPTTGTSRSLRADARRNQEQVLRAARHLFVERGLDCPLEDIARGAGVGIGTLYRHFVDRDGLITAVLLDALEQSSATARAALDANDGDGLDGIAGYLRKMLDVRVSAVIPLALDRLATPGLEEAREASAAALQELVDAAHADGSLPPEVSFGDLGTLLVRLSRPLPGVPAEVDNELAHRHLELVLAGLRGSAHLASEGMSRTDLHRLDGAPGDMGTA